MPGWAGVRGWLALLCRKGVWWKGWLWVSTVPSTNRDSKSLPLRSPGWETTSTTFCQSGDPQFKRCSGVREVKQAHQDRVEYSRSRFERNVSPALRNECGFLLQTTAPWQSTGNRHCARCCTPGLLHTSWNRKFQLDARNTFFNYEGGQIAEQAFQKGWGISILKRTWNHQGWKTPWRSPSPTKILNTGCNPGQLEHVEPTMTGRLMVPSNINDSKINNHSKPDQLEQKLRPFSFTSFTLSKSSTAHLVVKVNSLSCNWKKLRWISGTHFIL